MRVFIFYSFIIYFQNILWLKILDDRSVSKSSMSLVSVVEKNLFLTILIKKGHNTHVNQVLYQFVKNYILKIYLNEKKNNEVQPLFSCKC